MANIQKLPLFVRCVIQNFPFIEEDFDALTNYQLTSKVVEYLNKVISSQNEVIDATNDLQVAFQELHDYVENYFNNLDVQEEINNKIDAMVLNGTFQTILNTYVEPKLNELDTKLSGDIANETSARQAADAGLQTQITALSSGSPLVASDVSDMTDTTRVYVNTTDGKWYYYDGDSWEIGGTYQSSGISDNTITEDMLSSNLKNTLNNRIVDKDVTFKNGSCTLDISNFDLQNRNVTNGTPSGSTNATRVCNMNLIYVPANAYLTITGTNQDHVDVYYYEIDGTYINQTVDEVTKVHPANYVSKPRLARIKFAKATNTQDISTDYVIANFAITLNNFQNQPIVNYVTGNNLFDASKAVAGLLGTTGVIDASTSYKTSSAIKLNAYTTYHFSKFRKFILFDDNNRDVIEDSYVGVATTNYSVTPTETCYAVFSYANADETSIMVNSGDSALSYEPYVKYLDGITESGFVIGNIACLGDSIMYGDGTDNLKGLAKIMRDEIGFNLSANYSKGGATIHYQSDPSAPRNNIIYQMNELITANIAGLNYIFICGMTNDFNTATLGTLTDGYASTIDNTTFIGALEYIFRALKDAYPAAKVIFVRPHNMGSRPYDKQIQFGEGLLDTANKYSIPVVDVYKDGTLNTNFSSMYQYTNPTESQPAGDRTHPTNAAYSKFYIPLVKAIVEKIG